jgi:hypothetical protein
VQVVLVLKKEIMKTQSKEFEKGGEYRQILVQVRGGEAAAASSLSVLVAGAPP